MVDAGRRAMRAALGQAVRQDEAGHDGCPACGSRAPHHQGTVRRSVLPRFGRVVLPLRCARCMGCGRRFRPAAGCPAALGRDNITPDLAADGALAGASWPYATAARVLRRHRGAQVSPETLRQRCLQAGRTEAAAQQADAEVRRAPPGEQVRAERDAHDRGQRLGEPSPVVAAPVRLTVGLDGGWLPSREQRGGMEGQVGGGGHDGRRSGRQTGTAPPHAAPRCGDLWHE